MNEHRDVLSSTLSEHGGSGRPQPFVVGKGRRMLRGMELGLQGGPAPVQLRAGCCSLTQLPPSSCRPALHGIALTLERTTVKWRWGLGATPQCPQPCPSLPHPTRPAARHPLGVSPAEMTVGERALLDIKPEYAFLHKLSGLPLPEGARPEAGVTVDVTVRGGVCVGRWVGGGARGPSHLTTGGSRCRSGTDSTAWEHGWRSLGGSH